VMVNRLALSLSLPNLQPGVALAEVTLRIRRDPEVEYVNAAGPTALQSRSNARVRALSA